MALEAKDVAALVRLTLKDPQAGARAVTALSPGTGVLWPVFGLVVVVSVILAQVQTFVVPGQAEAMPFWMTSPFLLSLLQAGFMVLGILGTFHIGRAAGGTGSYADAFVLVVWLQVIMVLLQLVQTALTLVMPPLALLVGVVGVVLFFWLYVNFVAVLHGFRSLGSIFVITLGAMMVFVLVLGIAIGIVSLFLGAPADV